MDELALALQNLRYPNYTEVFQSLLWVFSNYNELKKYDYWYVSYSLIINRIYIQLLNINNKKQVISR